LQDSLFLLNYLHKQSGAAIISFCCAAFFVLTTVFSGNFAYNLEEVFWYRGKLND